jgi:hypothetical protein
MKCQREELLQILEKLMHLFEKSRCKIHDISIKSISCISSVFLAIAGLADGLGTKAGFTKTLFKSTTLFTLGELAGLPLMGLPLIGLSVCLMAGLDGDGVPGSLNSPRGDELLFRRNLFVALNDSLRRRPLDSRRSVVVFTGFSVSESGVLRRPCAVPPSEKVLLDSSSDSYKLSASELS